MTSDQSRPLSEPAPPVGRALEIVSPDKPDKLARPAVLFGIIAIAIVAIWRGFVLFGSGQASGADPGNWLAFGSFVRPGEAYPPLVPILFTSLVSAIGPILASAMAGAIASAIPALMILGLLTWARHPLMGALLALVTVSLRTIGAAVAWGGYPQPIALAMALLAIASLVVFLRSGQRRALALFALTIALVAATSHLTAVPAMAAIALVLAGNLFMSKRAAIRPNLAVLILALLPFVLLAPTYIALFSTLGPGVAVRTGLNLGAAFSVFSFDIYNAFWLLAPLTISVLLCSPLALLLVWRRPYLRSRLSSRDETIIIVAGVSTLAWFLVYVGSGQFRYLYDAEVLAALSLAAFVPLFWSVFMGLRHQRAGRLLVALAVGAMLEVSVLGFSDTVTFYRILTSDRLSAIEWMAAHPPTQPLTVLVAPVHSFPIGWWTEGILKQEVLGAVDLQFLRFPSEIARATKANELLYQSGFPDPASVNAIRQAGVQYVFLPDASAFHLTSIKPPPGWSFLFTSGDAIILAPAG